MKITNISKGPRGVNAAEGPVLLEPGESRDLDISEAELKVARKTEWFEFGAGKARAASGDDDAGKAAEAKRKAAASLLRKAPDMHVKTLESEAKAILGEDQTPTTKDEIVAALEKAAA